MPIRDKKAMLLRPAWVAGIIVLLAVSGVQGEVVTIELTGQITVISDPGNALNGQVNTGDIFTGFYKYDSIATDTNTSLAVGEYHYDTLPFGISLNIGGLVFSSDPQNVNFLIEVRNDYNSSDRYRVSSANNLPVNGATVSMILWQLDDNTGTALTSDAIPLIAPLSEVWTNNTLFINGSVNIQAQIIDAQSIPEPASAFLMALGASVFIVRSRKW